MSGVRICHNCKKSGLTDAHTVCPQCGASLSFANTITQAKAMETLRDMSVLRGKNTEYKTKIETLTQKTFGLRAKILGYWLLFISILTLNTCYHNRKYAKYDALTQGQRATINVLKKRTSNQDKIIASYIKMYTFRQPIIYYGKAVKPQLPLINEVIYVVEEGDDLEIVSSFFFGSNKYAHQIGSNNGLGDHDYIVPNQKIRIKSSY
jgi:hypothetical protein